MKNISKKLFYNNHDYKKSYKIRTEIVNGVCPRYEEYTMLVGVTRTFYECMTVVDDLKQHVKVVKYVTYLLYRISKNLVEVLRWRGNLKHL